MRNQCLEKDTRESGNSQSTNRLYIDDISILDSKFYAGLQIKAIQYCIDKRMPENSLRSFQLELWEEDAREKIQLRRYGKPKFDFDGEGGTCYRWILKRDDTIQYIRLVYHSEEGYLKKIFFRTESGDMRVIGDGEGYNQYFEFNMFKPFIGFYGSQDRYTSDIIGVGVYRDICTIAPASLPIGFGTFNDQEIDQLSGGTQEEGVTWENGEGSILDDSWKALFDPVIEEQIIIEEEVTDLID